MELCHSSRNLNSSCSAFHRRSMSRVPPMALSSNHREASSCRQYLIKFCNHWVHAVTKELVHFSETTCTIEWCQIVAFQGGADMVADRSEKAHSVFFAS